MAAGARQTIDALREQLARLEVVVDTQVTRLDVGLGNAVEAKSTLSTQLAEAILMLDSQGDRMETLEKTFEERMEELREKVLNVTEEFQERARSLEGRSFY